MRQTELGRPRVLDLFAGVGGFSLGFEAAGFETVAFSEIEPFPCAVLEHRWPDVPNLGDITEITREQIEALGSIDVVTFGSPCQDFSVAGKRLGMKGHRSSLFHEAIRVIRHARPRYALWENVPGVFSSAGGWDFAAVLDEMAELGALDVAWAVLDARHFGVPQRRRRVFLVADFAGECAGEILSIGQGVRGNTQAGRQAGQEAAGGAGGGVAGTLGGGSGSRGWADDTDRMTFIPETVGPLSANGGTEKKHGFGMGQQDWESGYAIPVTPILEAGARQGTKADPRDGIGIGKPGDPMFTLQAGKHHAVTHALTAEGFDASEDGTGRGTPLVPIQDGRGMEKGQNGLGVGEPGDPSYTLDSTGSQAVAFALRGREDGAQVELSGEQTSSIRGSSGGSSRDYVAFEPRYYSDRERMGGMPSDTTGPIKASDERGYSDAAQHVGGQGMAVRRLTPLETERLQGMPDGHTDVLFRGKPAADGPRYRACGNGVAVPVVRWIAERMAREL